MRIYADLSTFVVVRPSIRFCFFFSFLSSFIFDLGSNWIFNGLLLSSIVPTPTPPPRSWYISFDWSPFILGVQESIIECVREQDGQRVSPHLCPMERRPDAITRTCNDVPCPPRWNTSDFSTCSRTCGGGVQTREVHCIHEVARGGSNTLPVGADLCPQPPPRAQQFCNMIDCPVEWKTGEWSQVFIYFILFYLLYFLWFESSQITASLVSSVNARCLFVCCHWDQTDSLGIK